MSTSSKSTQLAIRIPNALMARLRNTSSGNLSKEIVRILTTATDAQQHPTDGKPWVLLPMDVAMELKRRSTLAELRPEVLIAEALREHWYMVDPAD